MSGYIDTREGWRELDVVAPDSIYQLAEYDPADGSVVRAWVRDLPIEPGLYVEANGNEWALRADGSWVAVLGVDGAKPSRFPMSKAEPRDVIAKAVLDRCEELAGYPVSIVQTVRREFGASS